MEYFFAVITAFSLLAMIGCKGNDERKLYTYGFIISAMAACILSMA